MPHESRSLALPGEGDVVFRQNAMQGQMRVIDLIDNPPKAWSKPRVGVGMGGGSGGVGGGVGVSLPIGKQKGERGTFTIDVIDSAKNAQVWSGSIDSAFQKAEISEDEARSVVEKVLAKFPDRTPR